MLSPSIDKPAEAWPASLQHPKKQSRLCFGFDRNSPPSPSFSVFVGQLSLFATLYHLHRRRFKFRVRVSFSEPWSRAIIKLDRHRGGRYGDNGNNQDAPGYRQSRGPSRFSDAPVNNHRGRRSPGNFRGGGGGGGRRPFDSPPRQGPGGFRHAGGRGGGGGGDDEYRGAGGGGSGGGRGFGQGYDALPPPPLAGQKRGFSSRGGGSPNPGVL